MSRLSFRIGFWASATQSVVSLVYVIGLIILVTVALSHQSPSQLVDQRWTDITTYTRHYADDQISLSVGLVVQISALIAGIMIPVIFLALHEVTSPEKKILTRIASTFTIMMAVTSSWGYYIQLASVHQTIISAGDLEGLSQFVEANVSSPGMATLQLAWAIFYGIATLVVVPVFDSTRSDKLIKVAFLFNGVIGIIVGIAYVFGATSLLPLAILGLVVASIAYPLLALRFHRLGKVV
jgi:hypothetical protein